MQLIETKKETPKKPELVIIEPKLEPKKETPKKESPKKESPKKESPKKPEAKPEPKKEARSEIKSTTSVKQMQALLGKNIPMGIPGSHSKPKYIEQKRFS